MNAPAHILVVDDDPAVRALVAHCLENAGYRVTAVGDGERGAELVADEDVRLAVLDIGLPGIDGLSLTRELRVLTDIGIIILSGRAETTDRIIGLEIGADDYLTKPIEPRELLARVRSVLRRAPGRSRTRDPLAMATPATSTLSRSGSTWASTPGSHHGAAAGAATDPPVTARSPRIAP